MTPAPISVERLAVSHVKPYGLMYPDPRGEFVRHSDYAALLHQLAELEAGNAALNAVCAAAESKLAERDAEVERLKVQLSESGREMELIWDEVQRVSPWSPSNDMLWSDEVATGIHFLAQRAETAGRLLRDCLDREYNPFERDNQSGHYNRIAAFLAASGVTNEQA